MALSEMKTNPSTPLHPLVNRSTAGHCPADPMNRTREKFFQIWSHKAANLSNQLIEYTIRCLQSDRLRHLFQTRNELAQQEEITPICQISMHIGDDLRRMKENIRQLCLMTRNVYRHLRSDSRLYPTMSIDLDQGVTIKICRFIFKTKVLIKMFTKGQHLRSEDQQKSKETEKKSDPTLVHDPYENITKAFVALESNFEILYGDIVGRDFFENAKAAVQTLPIILDISRTIRLIFCSLYKLSEPEREAEAEAMRQRRMAYCNRRCSPKNPIPGSKSEQMKNLDQRKQIVKELFKTRETLQTQSTTITPTPTRSKNISEAMKETSTAAVTKSQRAGSPHSTKSNLTTKKPPSSSTKSRPKTAPRKGPSNQPEKRSAKSSTRNMTKDKKSKNKNRISSSATSKSLSEPRSALLFHQVQLSTTHTVYEDTSNNNAMIGWTSWLENATRRLAEMIPSSSFEEPETRQTPSQPHLITWASLDRLTRL